MGIELVLPNESYREQVNEYKEKFELSGSSFDGSGSLKKNDFDTWLKECRDLMISKNIAGLVASTQYLAIRKKDGKLVGMINIRHHINHPKLKNYNGHIGYGVVPDERNKGYATKMTKLALEKCKELKIFKVMITCLEEDIASAKVIEKCGGIPFESITIDNTFTGNTKYVGKTLKRYWIDLNTYKESTYILENNIDNFMNYTLELNTRPSELEKIFDENHQNFITEKTAIWKKEFDKLVCVYNNKAVGYLIVYKNSDWVEQEEYPVESRVKEDCVYVWNMVTKKDSQGKGVATFLLKNLRALFNKKTIYVTANVKNIGSVTALERVGFSYISSFESKISGHKTIEKYNLYMHKSNSYVESSNN